MTNSRLLLVATALTSSFLLQFEAGAAQAPAPATTKDAAKKDTSKKMSTRAPATPPPSAAQISDAQSKGMVWVNKNTKVYHKSGEFYGKTKSGEFMTEADAQKAGYKAAQEPGAKKKKTAKTGTQAAPTK